MGWPVPGATVTVSQGEKRLAAVTDQQGAYSFPDLADGVWTIQVEMLCFSTIKQEIGIAASAPNPEWELRLLPLAEIKAEVRPAVAPGAAESIAPADTGQTVSDAFIVNGSVGAGIERRAIGNARKGPGTMLRGDMFSTLENSAWNARAFSSALAATNNFQKSQDTLYALATDTGGKALLDNNDLSAGVVQAQRAISSYSAVSAASRSRSTATRRRSSITARATTPASSSTSSLPSTGSGSYTTP